jgi:hypothetical protein
MGGLVACLPRELERDRRRLGCAGVAGKGQKRKGRSLGDDRPSLGPAWVWVSKPWGVWEGGFDEAAWGAAGGLSEFDYSDPMAQ